MPSIKSLVFGGLALGGVVAASYLTYRWYKNREESNTTQSDKDMHNKPAVTMSTVKNELPLEQEINEQQNSEIDDEPIQVPACLQGIKTMKEFEATLEALAAYLLVQERSKEELLEAQQELGWWWKVVVSFKDRVPEKIPDFEHFDDILPLTNEDGMQSVD